MKIYKDGFVCGLKNTWYGILNQFTLEDYLSGTANTLTFGTLASVQMVGFEVLKNIPSYGSNDYIYAAGFATEKGAEYLLAEGALSKEGGTGGNLLKWDFGPDHKTQVMTNHSTFRFNINGNIYGSSKQYPPSAPFQFWKYKK